jgi:hypothetical protein
MLRWKLSVLTAALSLVGAILWLALGRAAPGIIWTVISLGWLVAAMVQRSRPDESNGPDGMEPAPARRLARRFLRLILYWS